MEPNSVTTLGYPKRPFFYKLWSEINHDHHSPSKAFQLNEQWLRVTATKPAGDEQGPVTQRNALGSFVTRRCHINSLRLRQRPARTKTERFS